MGDNDPIGLFDSGLGGLTVFREARRLLPAESVIYFGDTANVPYGPRPVEELIGLADRIVAYLVGQGVKYIIFACNTSSALSLGVLRQSYRVPMLGIIEPGAAEAAKATKNKRIGVMATEATTNSGAYSAALRERDGEIQTLGRATPLLVPLVEGGETDPLVRANTVRESLAPWRNSGIDTMLLGCTHYPFLSSLIQEHLAGGVSLIDPAAATVREAAREMASLNLRSPGGGVPDYRFVVSGDPEEFRRKARRLTGFDPGEVTKVAL